MRFAWQGFFGRNHSWSVVAQNLTRQLIALGNEVDVFSTNGRSHIPSDLLPRVVGSVEDRIITGNTLGNDYDGSFSYTALKNANKHLQHSNHNRMLMWTYEFAGKNSLPPGFAKSYHHVDYILPPSTFARNIFLESGIPTEKMPIVVPHGINSPEIIEAVPYALKTKKTAKILINLGQLHRRKNIEGALRMFGEAFTKKDDVCLVLKIQEKNPEFTFELSFRDVYQDFESRYPNHAELEIVREFIPNIYSLYKSCDITFSPSHCEGFGMVPLEGLACGLIPIASNYGGFLEFLDEDNALLIEGKEFIVPPSYLYYQTNRTGTKAFMPDVLDGVAKLRYAVDNLTDLKKKAAADSTAHAFTWAGAAELILDLVK